MPTNLVIIVLVQGALCATILWLVRSRVKLSYDTNWLRAVGVGAVIGMVMDIVLGSGGLFGYRLAGHGSNPLVPHDLPTHVLAFNAFASYGIASTNIAPFAKWMVVAVSEPRAIRNLRRFFYSSLVLGLLSVLSSEEGSLFSMFAWGLVILGSAELLLLFCGKFGPASCMLTARSARPIIAFAAFSVLVGFVYEVINLIFPFWAWLPESTLDPLKLVCVVVFLGYMALFYPFLALYVFVTEKSTEWSASSREVGRSSSASEQRIIG